MNKVFIGEALVTVCVCPLDVEECQLSECEMGDGDSPLPRSSSTSDITQQINNTFPGIHTITHITHSNRPMTVGV